MGYDRGGGGGGYRGGGRGSRGGRGGGGRGGGGRRGGGRGGRSRGGRGPRRGPRDPREAAQSGNQRERIAVESGSLVFIDQFMLANPQFVDLLAENIDSDVEKKENIIKDYGGCVVAVEPGTYRIERDPFAPSIVVHREDTRVDLDSIVSKAESHLGRVFVDTRCLAMVDRELLDDNELLHKYQELWFAGEEKACRDLLRDNGGAVRYGFQRFGDELGIYAIPNEDVICLWPDVAESITEAAPPEAA